MVFVGLISNHFLTHAEDKDFFKTQTSILLLQF